MVAGPVATAREDQCEASGLSKYQNWVRFSGGRTSIRGMPI
jgi:hypothetical protein